MTVTYVLDTHMFRCVAKESSPTARREFMRLSQDREASICISVITEAEVRYGMAKHSLSRARQSAIEGLFANLQILPWGCDEAAAYARTRAQLEAGGISVAVIDMRIAAQAIAAGAVLVTRDKIFEPIDDLEATVNWATDL